MTESLSIRKVETKADFEVFLRFPWKIYEGDPYWVPPLVSMQRHKLDKKKNPTWQYMEGDYFIAWRGSEPVGTIAAFVNHRHNEYHHEHTGFFGLFELIDDQDVANALLETAAGYVRALGCDVLRGPASFTVNEEWGIVTEGFDDPPLILMPYTPRYYQRLVENAPGFQGIMDFYSYRFSLGRVIDAQGREKMMRVARKNAERRGIQVRPANPRELKRDLTMLVSVFNNAWSGNWGFVPFSEVELEDLVENLGRYVEPKLTFIAFVDEKPIAFLLAIPDLNLVLHRVYPRPGKPEILSLLQILWHWKVRSKINRLRVMLMGVAEGYRGIGVEAAMFIDLWEAINRCVDEGKAWDYGDGGWVLENNEPMQRLCDAFNGEIWKRYRCYQRTL